MRTKTVVMVGAAFVRTGHCAGARWQWHAQIPLQADMLAQVLSCLPLKAEPVTIVLDLPEQDYLIEPLPVLKKRDYSSYLQSRARQIFPGCPGGSGRSMPSVTPTMAVFGGMAQSTLIADLLDGLVAAGHVIDCVCFYADLVATIRYKAVGPQLWVLPGLGGGVRHVLARDGLALFTRLCQETDEQSPHGLAQDIANTCAHLESRMLLGTEQQLVIRLSHNIAEQLTEVPAASLPVFPGMPPHQLVVESEPKNSRSRLLQRRALVRNALPLPAHLLVVQRRYQLARRFAVASWGIAVLSGIYCGLLLAYSIQVRAEMKGLLMPTQPPRALIAESDAHIDQAVVQLFRKYPADIPDMQSALQSLSTVLLAFPQLQLDAVDWEPVDEADVVAAGIKRQLRLVLLADDGSSETSTFNTFKKSMLEQGAAAVSRTAPAVADARPDSNRHWHWLIAFASLHPAGAR